MLFIFDMGGVLTTSAAIHRDIAGVLGITNEDFLKYCGCPAGDLSVSESAASSDLLSLLSNGKITAQQFWHEFSIRSGRHTETDWWRMLFHPERNEPVYDIVRRLRDHNRVVCGTNTIESHYDSHLSRGDYAVFDQVYASHQMGVSKPNVRFWKIILQSENVAPAAAFFVDDRKENCEAAASLGITVHQFKDEKELTAVLSGLGTV
ncbi:MAG: HAD-IA family hydrolase [Treponema sp.]|jgi:putative hydrolase of the HAD superfamily|nr:HAD-IA family hydrolase [Treponema sp.]